MKGIPVLMIEGETLPEVWEKAVLSAWENGLTIKTEYDKPDDPPSKDCTMIMCIKNPFAEPRIHRAFPAGLEDLEIYRQEVVDGIHDDWINPEEGKWSYTYHQRLFNYSIDNKVVDQINYVMDKLQDTGYTRRAQAITWNPLIDRTVEDPPCLQRLWFRLVEDGDKLILNMNTHWRSRDAYKAAFMNIFALTDLQRKIAENLAQSKNKEVIVGRYVDMVDSFHIYGSYFDEFEKFLKVVKERSFQERTWDSKFAEPLFEDARKKLELEKQA